MKPGLISFLFWLSLGLVAIDLIGMSVAVAAGLDDEAAWFAFSAVMCTVCAISNYLQLPKKLP